MSRTPATVALVLLSALGGALGAAEKGDANWPQFRGRHAAGTGDGVSLPEVWDAASGKGVIWKTRIPGLAHSSPVVWGDQVFVATAISSKPDATFKPGLYGEGTASEDLTSHRFQVLSLDRRTGAIQWARTEMTI